MKPNIKLFLKTSSKSQNIFRYTDNDYIILKGNYAGKTILEMYREAPEFTIEMLTNMRDSENTNYHTSNLCNEIMIFLQGYY